VDAKHPFLRAAALYWNGDTAKARLENYVESMRAPQRPEVRFYFECTREELDAGEAWSSERSFTEEMSGVLNRFARLHEDRMLSLVADVIREGEGSQWSM